MNTYSIALRLRRVTYEDAYITVPVTKAMLREAEDGSHFINPEAVFAEGLRMGREGRDIEWQVESAHVEPHPTQQAAPEDRQRLAADLDAPQGG